MAFTTRQGRPSDIGALLKIMEECFDPSMRSDRLDYEGRIDKAPEHMIVGLVDGKPAGYASSLILAERPTVAEWQRMTSWDRVDSAADYHDPEGGCFYLGALAVRPQYRWSGFGTRLFMETAELARSKGHGAMYFITDKGRSGYFRKIGARMIDEETTVFYGANCAFHSFDTSKAVKVSTA